MVVVSVGCPLHNGSVPAPSERKRRAHGHLEAVARSEAHHRRHGRVSDRLDLQLAGSRHQRHRLRRSQHVARVGRPRRAARDRAARVGGDPAREHQRRDAGHAGHDDRGTRRPARDLHRASSSSPTTSSAPSGRGSACSSRSRSSSAPGSTCRRRRGPGGHPRPRSALRRPRPRRARGGDDEPAGSRAAARSGEPHAGEPPLRPPSPETPPGRTRRTRRAPRSPSSAAPLPARPGEEARRYTHAHGRDRDDARQERPRRDAQGRRDHGRRRRRAGEDRRGRRRRAP